MGVTFSQFFPPQPALTERNLARQDGKTVLVTGATSGVGFELARILYRVGAKVYVSGRSEESVSRAIQLLQLTDPSLSGPLGSLEPFIVDLSDLQSIRYAVDRFRQHEGRLHVLFNNAGVSQPLPGSKTAQGYELQIGVNCLAPLLLAELLLPVLRDTASCDDTVQGSVRVVWTSSQVVELSSPKGGFPLSEIIDPPNNSVKNYTNSKTGNYYLARQFADITRADMIISVTQNPGNLRTNLLRNAKWMMYASYPLLYDARMGAYTELWAGFSTDLTLQDSGSYLIPWGRKHTSLRSDLVKAAEDGTGAKFYQWCKEQVSQYM